MLGDNENETCANLRRYEATNRQAVQDGSLVRNLMPEGALGADGLSMAEVVVPAGGRTVKHRHQHAEICHVATGSGWVTLDQQRLLIAKGDTFGIPPGVEHFMEAASARALRLIRCCNSMDVATADAGMSSRKVCEADFGGPRRECPVQLLIENGHHAESFRRQRRLSQTEFWAPVLITQGGGSRYESGRDVPVAVLYMLHLAYASDAKAQALLDYLRGGKVLSESFPNLSTKDGRVVRDVRGRLDLTQGVFWGRLQITQAAGSRYESGRPMPRQIPPLLILAYAPLQQASARLALIRAAVAA